MLQNKKMNNHKTFKDHIGEEWYEILKDVETSGYWGNIQKVISEERSIRTIYPEIGSNLLFKAFRTTSPSKLKVVILGQDPYHDGSYDGYAFSNSLEKRGRISPSLSNILTEVHSDIYIEKEKSLVRWLQPEMVNLERWAKQGVLLINTAHTVVKGVPDSHIWLWKPFTMKVIKELILNKNNLVWILWGRRSQNTFWKIFEDLDHDKDSYLQSNMIIESSHPSPFSAYQGFFGSKPFSKTNEYLIKNNITPIIW